MTLSFPLSRLDVELVVEVEEGEEVEKVEEGKEVNGLISGSKVITFHFLGEMVGCSGVRRGEVGVVVVVVVVFLDDVGMDRVGISGVYLLELSPTEFLSLPMGGKARDGDR